MAAIQTEELTKYYGETRGVEGLSFAVDEGEVFGFLGPNGAGKTTTIRTLLGLLSPSSGTATVLGHDVRDEAALIEARKRIGYLPSDPGFGGNVTGRRLLDYFGSLKGDERSEDLLELFTPPLDRKVGEYSRGNKQMLAIVIAFMHDPDLVVMDEPTSGLDPLMQERFYEFIRAEQARGTTFFFSSHVLSEVRKVCDRVGIIRDGHLVELEDVRTLLERGGKSVRVRVAEPVARDDFALAGVHDLTVGGEAADPMRSDGGEPASERGPVDAGGDPTTITFTYTGGYNALLEHLLGYTILDLDVEEAPLEDVFMRFYGEGGGN